MILYRSLWLGDIVQKFVTWWYCTLPIMMCDVNWFGAHVPFVVGWFCRSALGLSLDQITVFLWKLFFLLRLISIVLLVHLSCPASGSLKNIYVTHSDKRMTKSLGRPRDNWGKHRLGDIFFFFFFFHIVGRLLYHFLTSHRPFGLIRDFERHFKWQKPTTLT